MRSGMLAATFLVLFAPSLALAADPPIVYQTQPLGRLLDELRTLMQSVAGDEAVQGFNKEMKQKFGDAYVD